MPLTRTHTYADATLKVTDCTGKLVVDQTNPITMTTRDGHYHGARTPNYHSRVKSGAMLPLNYYNRWDYEMSRDLVSGTAVCDCGGGKVHTAVMTNWLGPVSNYLDPENLSNKIPNPWDGVNTDALILAAMADILPDLDALTTAIEARQTIRMVVNARRDAKKLILEALRGGKHTAKAAADAWLAWRYGWEQLGRDIENCYELLKEPYMSLVVTGQSGEDVSRSEDLPEGDQQYWEHGAHYYGDLTHDISVRARVIAKWRGQTLSALADPAISFWETVPYSFVADWFVNVGDVLGAWKVRNSVSSIYASLGHKTTSVAFSHRDFTEGLCDNITVPSGGSVSREKFTWKQRFPASIPSLVPSFTVRLTSKRIADAAALLSKRIL